jgi:hypothetical protein
MCFAFVACCISAVCLFEFVVLCCVSDVSFFQLVIFVMFLFALLFGDECQVVKPVILVVEVLRPGRPVLVHKGEGLLPWHVAVEHHHDDDGRLRWNKSAGVGTPGIQWSLIDWMCNLELMISAEVPLACIQTLKKLG